MNRTGRSRLFLPVLALTLLVPRAAASATLAATCSAGEFPVSVYRSVRVPATVANASRGDVLLTQGIATNPVNDLLGVLNQLFVHTSMIGGTDALGTRVTHTTALSLGKKLIEYNILKGVRFKPEWLRRLPPGNVVRDPLDTVLSGNNSQCLNTQDPNTCWSARSQSHVRSGCMLLKPKPGFETKAQAAVTWAESLAPHSFRYSVSAYSDLEGAWTNTGLDDDIAGDKPGTMCSGIVKKALNAGGIAIANRNYSESDRELAANALYSAVFSQISAAVTSFVGEFLGSLPPILTIQISLANQVVDCFAFGGKCNFSPLIGDWELWSLDSGASTSPDDLIPNDVTYASVSGTRAGVQGTRWARMEPATFAGGYTNSVFDHTECCHWQGLVRVCRIAGASSVATITDATTAAVDRHRRVRNEKRARKLVAWISEAGGEYRESDGSYCYVTGRGEVCTILPDDSPDESADNSNR